MAYKFVFTYFVNPQRFIFAFINLIFVKRIWNYALAGLCLVVLSQCIGSANALVDNAPEGTTGAEGTSDALQAGNANKFDWAPITYDSNKQYIYLTFDDGPQPGTLTCYDLCRKENIKASFFMVGLHAALRPDGKSIVSMIRESYPQILLANHSYTHANGRYEKFYKAPELAERDFAKAQDSLNVPFKIVRLPGNSAWDRENDMKASWLVKPVTHLLDSAGFNVIGWDVEWRFGHKTARPIQSAVQMAADVDSAFTRNRTHVKNQLVILTHDRMFKRPDDADSLAKFITLLKSNPRYVLETVDHYPDLKRPVRLAHDHSRR